MVVKILAGIVMGIVVAVLATLVFGMGSGGGESGGRAGLWSGVAGFIVVIILAITAERGRYAWGRGFLIAGLLCLAMPLASILFSGLVGASAMGQATSDAGRAGAAVGTALAGGALTVASGFIGFFLGLIFLVGSYFALRTR